MAVRYHTIFSKIWIDPEFKKLSANAKLLLLALRTCPESNMASIFTIYPEIMSRYIGKDAKTVKECLKELKHFIIYQDDIVWIRNGLKFNKHISLKNIKQKKSIQMLIDDLPSCEVVIKFCQYYGIETHADTIVIPLTSDSDTHTYTHSEGYGKHDTDTDTESDTDTEKTSIPYQKISDLWNEYATEIPKVTYPLSKGRKDKVKTRWKEHPDLEYWESVFKKVQETPFCCGDNDRGWKVSFDWIFTNDENYLKVMEGKYIKTKKKDPWDWDANELCEQNKMSFGKKEPKIVKSEVVNNGHSE